MATYTVHEPPLRNGEAAADPERFVFVRDGFHFWAFLLTPLWLLLRRLWLVLLGYVVLLVVLGGTFYLLNVPPAGRFAVTLLLGLLIGFEAATLRRWTLARRGWRAVGLVVADDAEAAERRFFDGWVARTASPSVAAPSAEAIVTPRLVRRGPPSGSDVIGLFPEPGGPR